MSSTWLFKTPQMNEPGKEILLREAIVYHLRSSRDRQMLATMAGDMRPLEDILSFFASFYLYYYQGLRLLQLGESSSGHSKKDQDIEHEEQRLLELEVRQILGDSFRENIDVVRLASEFMIALCNRFTERTSKPPFPADVKENVKELIVTFLQKIPSDYSPNSAIDFINEITEWGNESRRELYAKASGLKESALTLREELMREREEEVIEITTLKRTIVRLLGQLHYLHHPLRGENLTDDVLNEMATAVLSQVNNGEGDVNALRLAHQLRIALLDFVEENIETPVTISEFERELAQKATTEFLRLLSNNPDLAFPVISHFIGLPEDDVRATLRQKGIRDPSSLLADLAKAPPEVSVVKTKSPTFTKEELEEIERSMRRLEKIERTLEGPVKGMLKARGLRASELDRISIDFLTKDPRSLIAIEQQVFDELRKKMKLPTPEEMRQLLETRKRVKDGELGNLGVITAADMGQKRIREEAIAALKSDLAWYLIISVMTNIARVMETYVRSKQDLLRIRAVLKSIYEDTEIELQYLREEILIDLLSLRIYEMKCVHALLDAPTICAWMHARLSNQSLDAAKTELDSTPSPVFEGVIDAPLALAELEFDNYAIAYDIMHRFLARQRLARAKREELALEEKMRERELILSKRKGIDALNFIYTKAHTVFRAIGRVGTKGLEWGPNDDMKCANLLEFYLRTNRGRPVCRTCGATPKDGKCPRHGKGHMTSADDMDNLSVFVMQAITDIKTGLIGATAEPMSWDKARALVQREIASLRRQGRLTSKTNLRKLLPGEVSYAVGPRIASVIGKYFNESLRYAAKRAGLA